MRWLTQIGSRRMVGLGLWARDL